MEGSFGERDRRPACELDQAMEDSLEGSLDNMLSTLAKHNAIAKVEDSLGGLLLK